ncbi:hypothetical protein EUX98_g2969 [Antrodiella citrinella]|uniref:Uncharacterized protein n=1 Tax=Antrodiella citrinella TaxID=2447956 RepID=A0A4S4N0I5_9APHY|nr:hypothetical protein EUX98_g2969 [Antrodiella citrinella]
MLYLLHQHEHPEAKELLKTLKTLNLDISPVTYTGPIPGSTLVYVKSGLPCVLMDIVLDPDMFSDEPDTFKAEEYNLIAIIIFQLIQDIKDSDSRHCVMPATLLRKHDSLARTVLKQRDVSRRFWAHLTLTCTKIWHKKLEDIKSVQPMHPEQIQMKAKALVAWREYGEIFNLREGFRVPTPESVVRAQ